MPLPKGVTAETACMFLISECPGSAPSWTSRPFSVFPLRHREPRPRGPRPRPRRPRPRPRPYPACAAPRLRRAPGVRAILALHRTRGVRSRGVDREIQTQQQVEWSTTGKLALWNSQHLLRCHSYLLIPWRCGSEMAAKSATYWGWH